VANESSRSPAAIARTQADDGSELTHPDILDADVRWRLERLFTAEELNFDTPAAAIKWMGNLSCRVDHERLRPAVLNLKRELESVVASGRTTQTDRQLAREVGQWLRVWLQNPEIFDDWFELRRKTPEFIQLFGS
jgi:hypothetical protein